MTDKLRDAAEVALTAMDKATRFMSDKDYQRLNQTIELLRAALAEQDAEPVAWMDIDENGNRLTVRQWSDGNKEEVPLYTHPPRREWVGLTEAERVDVIDEEVTAQNTEHFALAQRIEAALKEKNHDTR